MTLHIHTSDYIKMCLSCPLADCIGADSVYCPIHQQAQADRDAGNFPPIAPRWLTLAEVARELGLPHGEVEREFYKLRQAGASIPGAWQRGMVWYYDRRKLDYYRRLVAPPDYGDDRPPLAQGNSHDDPAWVQERPVVVRVNGNGAVQILQ